MQKLDLEIVSREEQLVANASAAQQCKARGDTAAQALRQAEKDHASLKLELQHAEQSLKQTEEAKAKLLKQSATIKKNDEYQAVMAQIASLDQTIAQGEEQVLNRMDQLEAHLRQVENTRRLVEQRQAAVAQELRAHAAEKTRLEKERQELKSQRANAVADVPPALLRRYDLLRASKIYTRKQPALVSVDEGTCARCHRRIPSQHCDAARHGELGTCENCGAMLFSEAFLNEEDIHI